MHFKRNSYIYILALLLLMIIVFQFIIPATDSGLYFYVNYIFAPLQNFRLDIVNNIQISIGDILYLLLILYIIVLIVRLGYLIIRRKGKANALKKHSRIMSVSILSIYLCLAIAWNVNYSREKLYKQLPNWDLQINTEQAATALHYHLVAQFKTIDTLALSALTEAEINDHIRQSYFNQYGTTLPNIYTKESLFGNIIEAMGIQGYYNPITGENQYNKDLPKFLHPFIIAHEMAHQLGIAAEGDANLLGYITCVNSDNISIQYSGYFNLFLYNINTINRIDKNLAQQLIKELPENVQRDYETLIAFRKKNSNLLSDFTIPIYNFFLKSNGQEGVTAYRNLAHYGYVYEILNKRKANLSIRPYN